MEQRTLIEALTRGTVTVVGDVMLDHYVLGHVGRISPEAPVPVLQVTEERNVAGAAANVAANIAALGGQARLVGLIGSDLAGEQLMAQLGQIPGLEVDLQVQPQFPTIVKTRYISGQQQIVRVDRERPLVLDAELERALIDRITDAVAGSGCVVLSDYGKGLLADPIIAAAIAAARAAGAAVVVDPKRRDLGAYRGADYITPNTKELTDATGMAAREDEEAASAAAVAIAKSGAAILLTRSERGMSLYRSGSPTVHKPAQAREVFDVSGAGDTVIAAFGLSLAAGLNPDTAMAVANAAAGVVVGKLGTAVCTAAELDRALSAVASGTFGGEEAGHPVPLSLAEAVALRAEWGRQGLKVGFTNGCFDLIHPGHVSLLRQAAAACDRLIVALNTDRSVKALKGDSRPVQTELARAQVMAAIKGVAGVVLFDEPTPLEVITALQPDLLVKGADYQKFQVVGADLVEARGGEVLLVSLEVGQSTSRLVQVAQGG